jgi:hypothetical protein
MMKRMAIAGIAALTAAACSSIQVEQDFAPDTDFSAYQTWDWLPVEAQSRNLRAENPLVDQRIRRAVESELASKGYRQVTSGQPDLMVGYHLIIDEQVDYQTVNDAWGPGWGYGGMYVGYGAPMASSTRTYTNRFTVGTLILDMFDVEARELVWRGSAEGELQDVRTPEERQERANAAVAEILDGFPPGS